MKLYWFYRPDRMMRRAYAVGALVGMAVVWSLNWIV